MWKKRQTRYALLGLLGAVVAFAALRPRPLSVEIGVVTRGPLTVTVDEEGRTRVKERFVVAAPIAGRLRRVILDEGDPVEERAILAEILPAPLDSRTLAQARARVLASEAAELAAAAVERASQARFDQARGESERSRELSSAGLQTRDAQERADLAAAAAAAELAAALRSREAATHGLAEARATLLAASANEASAAGSVAVRAPARGTILRVLQESDRVVAAGSPLFEIGDMNDLEVVTELVSSDATGVAPGAPVCIEGLGPYEATGHVRRVEPSAFTKISALGVEEQRVNAIVDFDMPPRGVGDGYRVEVRISVWEHPSILRVPGSALFRDGLDWRAYVVVGGRVVSRLVEIGHRTTTEAEVLSGLRQGDRVVLYPGDRVKEGARVRQE